MSGSIQRIRIPDIVRRKGGQKLSMVTVYDAPSARCFDASGVEILLVGDSLAMVVLGHPTTLEVTMDEMVHHTRAAARGRSQALLIGDMPWLSYHLGNADAVTQAARFIRAGADAVKLEGGARRCAVVEALVDAEIPVMGHIGLTPQSFHRMGGFKVQGRDAVSAAGILEDARRLVASGVFALVLEGIPAELAAEVTAAVSVPTIGIGAGVHCDGQVLVAADLLGLSEPGSGPRFVRRYAELGALTTEAGRRFVDDVRRGLFPSAAESYHSVSDGGRV